MLKSIPFLFVYEFDLAARRAAIMPKPQASAWGIPDKSSVASERRFMVDLWFST